MRFVSLDIEFKALVILIFVLLIVRLRTNITIVVLQNANYVTQLGEAALYVIV